MKTNRNFWIGVTFLLILAIMLVACGGEDPTATPVPEEPTPVPQVEEPTAVPEVAEPAGEAPEISQPIYRWGEVADRLWVLVGYGDALNPTVVEEGTVITAVFSSVEPTVSGSGGCNNYFASYESTNDGGLTVSGPIGATMMFCEESMDQETAYLAALETVSAWSLNEEGRLEVTYSTGQPYDEKLVYAPGETPLAGTTWKLVSYGDPEDLLEVETGTSVTAIFLPETDTTGTVGGNATCNSYSTSFTLDGDQITFGPIAGTLMMCPVGADQEAAYLAALGSAQTYQITGVNLQIAYDGGVLNYTSLDMPLENVLWQALLVAGTPVPEGVEITVLFTPGEEAGMGNVGGSAGCNSYSTSYETSNDLSTNPTTNFLTVGSPMAMTMAICPDEELANLETAYIAALEAAETYEILGDQLVLHTGSGDVQYTADRQPLLGTLWALTSVGSVDDPQPPLEGSNFTAQFSRLPSLPSGTVVGETGCNSYNATFTANLSEIKVNLPATTRVACEDALAEAEQQFFLGLNAATEYRILGNVLQIPYGEGEDKQVLNFVATPPEGEAVIDLTPLADTFWYLLSIGDNALLPFTEITAGFTVNDDGITGAVSGSSGCNAYNAAIGQNFSMGPIVSTQKACPTEVLDQEGGYLDWLGKAYNYSRAGDQLLISTANGVLTYNSTPVLDQSLELQNKTWYLVSVGTLTAVPGSNATTFFASDGSTVSGNTGCNEISGSYKTEPGNLLTISGFASTQAACASEALTKQEEALVIFLPSAVSYVVYDNQMQIQTVDGSVINYTAIPPAQPKPPTAVILSEDLGDIGQLLTFDGSQSTPGDAAIVGYTWDMGDGSILSDPVVVYTYDTPGGYNVSLTVVDKAGQSNTTTKPIQISPVAEVFPPTAVIAGPTTAIVGEPVTFSAANSQQGTAAISSYQWQAGDGNNTGPGPDNSFTTIYLQPGVYYPSVIVADVSELTDSASMEIVVNAKLPGMDWVLSDTLPGTTITLNFGNGKLSGFGGCNTYNGSYRVPGKSSNVKVDPITSTGAICSEEIMNQEQGYFAALQSASKYAINGSTLTLTTADGPLTFYAAVAAPAPTPTQ